MESASFSFGINKRYVPFYISEMKNKIISGKIVHLYQLSETRLKSLDTWGRDILNDKFYRKYGNVYDNKEKWLSPIEYLRSNNSIYHAYITLIPKNKRILALGYSVFKLERYVFSDAKKLKHNVEKIFIDEFSSFKIDLLENGTGITVRGVGQVTLALAANYAIQMNSKHPDRAIAVGLVARPDPVLSKLYKSYGLFEDGDIGLGWDFKTAKSFLSEYEKNYKKLERPQNDRIPWPECDLKTF
jgi:hypothetical protein